MTPRERLDALISGFRATQIIRTAAIFGVADILAAGPLDAAQVAARAGCATDGMHRLLRGLAVLGVVAERPDGTFANTDVGQLLRAGVDGSLRLTAIARPQDSWWSAWAHLPDAVRDGAGPYEVANGRSFWDFVAAEPAVAAQFNEFMTMRTTDFLPRLLAGYDFSGARHIVDLGGGSGALIGGILRAFPDARGEVFDVAAGLADTSRYLESLGVRDRCDLTAGSFFEAVPEGADVYILRQILHDWPDDRVAQILATCRRAMTTDARLLVIDQLLPAHADETDRTPIESDLHMLVMFGARERTEDELTALLADAGLRMLDVVRTEPERTLIAAR